MEIKRGCLWPKKQNKTKQKTKPKISGKKITNNTVKQEVPIKQDMFLMLDNISQLLSLIRFDRVISCGL